MEKAGKRPRRDDKESSGGERRSSASSRRPSGPARPYRKREEGEDAPRERKPVGSRTGGKPGFGRSGGAGRPAFGRKTERPDGDRPAYRPRRDDDRPSGDRPAYRPRRDDDRPAGERPAYRARRDEDRPAGDRPAYRDRKDRPAGGGRRFGADRGDKPFRKREEGDKPFRTRHDGDTRPYKGPRKSEGGRPQMRRPAGSSRPVRAEQFKSKAADYNPAAKRAQDAAQTEKHKPKNFIEIRSWSPEDSPLGSSEPAPKKRYAPTEKVRLRRAPAAPQTEKDEVPGDAPESYLEQVDEAEELEAAPEVEVAEPLVGAKPRVEASAAELQRLYADFSKTRTQRIRYAWIFDTMVAREPEDADAAQGNTVLVYDGDKFLGSAIYNRNSKIRGRIFSLQQQSFDQEYIESAVRAAVSRRRLRHPEGESFRVIYGDSDGLPGVVADLLGGVLVVQLLTLAADQRAKEILEVLHRELSPSGTVIRRDVPVREKEGLPLQQPEVTGEVPDEVAIQQDGFTMFADLVGGQKTGLFLDQRQNRRLIAPYCSGARVLDLFSHVGGWAFTAAKAGAKEVVCVDSSASAIRMARRGAEANGFEQIRFETEDVFEYLEKLSAEQYDVVVCDPPAFAKTRTQAQGAVRAYLSLNYRAMKLLPVNGVLATCSCSQNVTDEEFEDMLITAARNARMQFQIVARTTQPPDHPILLGFPESEYLKCYLLQRVE